MIESLFEVLCEADIVRPTFVTGHPVEISPLARVDRNDPYVTERFELFVDSRELANGYSELNDPVEQRARFEEEDPPYQPFRETIEALFASTIPPIHRSGATPLPGWGWGGPSRWVLRLVGGLLSPCWGGL